MSEGNSEFSENQGLSEKSPTDSSKSFLEKATTSAKNALQVIENKTGLTKAGLVFMTALDSAAATFGSIAIAEGDIVKAAGLISSAVGANYFILGGSRRFFPHRYEQPRDEKGRFTKRS
ncbi:hypothetical protein HYU92_02635 [Candidatus Curtissbacteria bacterium]|nr:hypothetical protein [Candidatus Curtissbacteria bacterium]